MRLGIFVVAGLSIALGTAFPAEAGHTASEVTYVLGTSVSTPAGSFGAVVCQSPPNSVPLPIGVGGGCSLTAPNAPSATITVTDAAINPVSFGWAACGAGGAGLAVAAIVLPPGCDHVTVFVRAPATTGTIGVT